MSARKSCPGACVCIYWPKLRSTGVSRTDAISGVEPFTRDKTDMKEDRMARN